VPREGIQASVHHGWITLRGEVEWLYQKSAAERSVRYLPGVRGASDEIVVRPPLDAEDVRSMLADALRRNVPVESNGIRVHARDGTVRLDGRVRFWSEREEAERASWAAPGTVRVENHLKVVYS
jgi:osmotically-inducible protein OsmY